MKRKENIVIIGGGFAGVNAAKKILQINTNSFVGSVASVRIKYKNLSNLKVKLPIYRMI